MLFHTLWGVPMLFLTLWCVPMLFHTLWCVPMLKNYRALLLHLAKAIFLRRKVHHTGSKTRQVLSPLGSCKHPLHSQWDTSDDLTLWFLQDGGKLQHMCTQNLLCLSSRWGPGHLDLSS